MSVSSILGQDHKIDPLYIPDSAFAVPTLSEVLSTGNTSGANDIILGVPGTSKQAVQNVDILDAETVRTNTIKQVADTDPKVVRVEANLLLKEGETAGEGVLEFELCNGTIATGAGKSLTLDTQDLHITPSIGTGVAFGNVLGFDTATGKVQYQSAGGGGGGGIVASVVGGSNITVDNTSPANPVVNVDAALTGITSIAGLTNIEIGSTLDFQNVNLITNCPTIDGLLPKSEALYVNSHYVNEGVNDIQTVINAIGSTEGQVIYVGAGSYSGSELATLLESSNLAIIGPSVTPPICELPSSRDFNTSGNQIRIENIKIGGFTRLGGNWHTTTQFINCQLNGLANGQPCGNDFIFTDCDITSDIYLNNAFDGTITFIRCNFAGATFNFTYLPFSRVIFMNCINLPNRPPTAIFKDTNTLAAGAVGGDPSVPTIILNTDTITTGLTNTLVLKSVNNIAQLTVSNTGVALGGALDMNTNAITDSAGVASSLELLGGELLLKDQQNTVLSTVPLPTPPASQSLAEVLNVGNTANQDIDMDANSFQNVAAVIGASNTDTVIQAGSGHSLVLKSQDATTQLTVSDTGVEIAETLKIKEALTYTPTISSAIEVADTYVGTLAGLTVQNKDTGNNSSSNIYLSGNNATETNNYLAFGRNNSAYTAGGTNPTTMDGQADCAYLANTDGSIAVIADYFGTQANAGIHLGYEGGTKAISIKADTGELSLGTTFTNGGYVYNPGTAGQVLTSQGPGAAPVWSTGGGGVASVSAGTNISVTGTATDPIVNLSVSADIDMNAQAITNCTSVAAQEVATDELVPYSSGPITATAGFDMGTTGQILNCPNIATSIGVPTFGTYQLKNYAGNYIGDSVPLANNLFEGPQNATLRFFGINQIAVSQFLLNTNSAIIINSDGSPEVTGVCLDIRSSNDNVTFKGVALPRMKEAQRLALVPGVPGVAVYQDNLATGIYVWEGTSWTGPLGTGGGGSTPTLSQVLIAGSTASTGIDMDSFSITKIGGLEMDDGSIIQFLKSGITKGFLGLDGLDNLNISASNDLGLDSGANINVTFGDTLTTGGTNMNLTVSNQLVAQANTVRLNGLNNIQLDGTKNFTNGVVQLNGSAGTAGQFLMSKGASTDPVYGSVGGSSNIAATYNAGTNTIGITSTGTIVENTSLINIYNNSATTNLGSANTIIGNSQDFGPAPFVKTMNNQPQGSGASASQFNTILGIGALQTNATTTTAPQSNTSIGVLAGPYPLASTATDVTVLSNTCVGQQALGRFQGTSCQSNVAIGFGAGLDKGGNDSVVIGRLAGRFANNDYQVIIGREAAGGNNGYGTVAVGGLCGRGTGGGNESTYLGFDCGFSSVGSGHVFLGNRSGYRVSGDNNIIIGSQIQQNATTATYSNKLFIGCPSRPSYIEGDMAGNTFTMSGLASLGNAELTAATVTSTAGGNSGQHLRININGTFYKIALLQD